MSSRTYLSIGDVLTLLREEFPDVTISKIRFLESQGLVNPERSPSGYRKFFDHDVERLRWVLRQQREHFLPLKVIRDRLASGELDDIGADPPNGKQARHAPSGAEAGSPAPGPGGRGAATDQGRRGGDGADPGRCLPPGGPSARGGPGAPWAPGRRRRRAGCPPPRPPPRPPRPSRARSWCSPHRARPPLAATVPSARRPLAPDRVEDGSNGASCGRRRRCKDAGRGAGCAGRAGRGAGCTGRVGRVGFT